jgi:hypothetical protein
LDNRYADEIIGRFQRDARGFLLGELNGVSFARRNRAAADPKLDSKGPAVVGA